MRPRDRDLAKSLDEGLRVFDRDRIPLLGIRDLDARSVFLEQMLESIHRVKFVQVLSRRNISNQRANPESLLFDPLKAAILHQREGQIEESYWLLFLFVYFGKNPRGQWRFTRDVYGRLGRGRWDWASISTDISGFRNWIEAKKDYLQGRGIPGGFGNHRKYESLNETGLAVQTYVAWVNPPRTHAELMKSAVSSTGNDPRRAFDLLYRSMKTVHTFGRTARFDYLTMIGKLRLAPIEPGSTYMSNSTGPLKGARLLFGANQSATDLQDWLVDLDNILHVGMQVLEDALCNWQKSPGKFKRFRG